MGPPRSAPTPVDPSVRAKQLEKQVSTFKPSLFSLHLIPSAQPFARTREVISLRSPESCGGDAKEGAGGGETARTSCPAAIGEDGELRQGDQQRTALGCADGAVDEAFAVLRVL